MPVAALKSVNLTDTDSLVRCTVEDAVGRLTLNHPQRRNALSQAMLEALQAGLRQLEADTRVRVVVIAAEGTVFSAGHDLREMQGFDDARRRALLAQCTQVMESVRLLAKPVIAQVQGLASAAGCQLAASCDLVVASQQAGFQTPGLKTGLFCSTPMVPLSRVVPAKKALEMLFTAEVFSATEAHGLGLVNRVVPQEALEEETSALAKSIAQYSGETLAIGKAAFYRQLPLEHEAAYALGCETMACNAQTEDAQEGMRAFLEKRQPVWQH